MARYIDADKAKEHLLNLAFGHEFVTLDAVLDHFDDIPTADVANVVRCCECAHKISDIDSCGCITCEINGHWDADGYCSYGAKMDLEG